MTDRPISDEELDGWEETAWRHGTTMTSWTAANRILMLIAEVRRLRAALEEVGADVSPTPRHPTS